ncbi:hypothetical protein [Methylobacterium indicum]|uniref:Uncharacterized protein n=1 Tax=Methylobacterium indicum TaxID=1775910 RepID=A0ABR5HEP7_9HYPH|nr:hypothetical protein [Methylobacterium indicum]KMO18898.1 hypothetical protein QR78_14405 [Methylobacterium indicum]KMO25056.1 hypothetical protein QR79_09795 [Methylobacterium indicum]
MPNDFQGRVGLLCMLLCLVTFVAAGAMGEWGLLFPAAAFWFCSYACHQWRKEERQIREREALWDRRLHERLGIR